MRTPRPKLDIKARAAEHGEDSLDTLVWLRDHAESEQVRLGATTAILDRAYGRPRQEVDVNASDKTIVIVDRGRPLRKLQATEPFAIEHQSPDDAG
jgi:hypothetical protein